MHVFFSYSQTFRGIPEHEQQNEESCSCKVSIKLCVNEVCLTDNPKKGVGMSSELYETRARPD